MDWVKVFFSPDGRIDRQTYWIGWLVLLGVNSLLGWTVLAPLVGFYCWICISVKRFHDMGKSGWLAAIPSGVGLLACISIFPIVGAAILAAGAGADENATTAAVLSAVGGSVLVIVAAFVVGLVFLIWQGVAQSQPGENRYGPAPASAIAQGA